MKRRTVFFEILIFQALAGRIAPAFSAGNFAGSIFLKPPSARSAAMAEAASSLGADEAGVSNFHYNPAAAAHLKNPEVSLMGQRGITEDSFGAAFVGLPTVLGTFSAGLLYYTLGDINLINASGVTSTVNAQKDLGFAVNYAEEIFGVISTGLTLKYLNSKLVDSLSANAFAVDAGVQTQLEDERISLGFSVLNIGSDLKYLDASEPLPLTVRMGGSYRLPLEDMGKALFCLDVLKEKDNDFKNLIGMDYLWSETFSVRGGYKIGQDQGGVNAGLGFQTGNLQVHYSITSLGRLGLAHSFSTSLKFGSFLPRDRLGSSAEQREKRRSQVQKIRKASRSRKITIAILGLNALGTGHNTAALLADELYLAFTRKPKVFDVVASEKVRDTIAQTGVDLVQCADVACLKSVGEKLGADKVVTGILTKSQGIYTLNVRMVDVETGAIEVTEAAKSESFDHMEYEVKDIVNSFAKSAQ